MHEIGFLLNIGMALLAALVGGAAARLLRLPVLIGYLLAGIAIGPHTPGIMATPEVIHEVANLGVALLMFAVGVHFSLEELKAVRRTALIGGGLQIVGTIVLGIAVGRVLGWGVYGGLYLGCAMSLSSTAVMMKLLEECGELGSPPGKVMLGVLVAQDLSLVLLVPLLPAFAAGSGGLAPVGLALLIGGLLLAATLLLALRGVPALMHQVARLGSPELFLLTGLGICLVAAIGAEQAGLGLALGAFLAGIVVSETEYAHELSGQIRPLRDVFAALFFVSVGMLLDPAFLRANWQAVLLVTLAIVVGKGLIAALAVYAAGHHGRTAIVAGLGLAQIGEFSFVLAQIGSSRKLIPDEISGVILSAALITLLLAPFVYNAGGPLYARLAQVPMLARRLNRQGQDPSPYPPDTCPVAQVVVLGYGRIGRYVSDALRRQEVAHFVVDYDTAATAPLRGTLAQVIYGDAASETVLAQTVPHCLHLAIVALPEAIAGENAVRVLKHLAPALPVLARVHRGTDIPRFRAAGADAVVHAEFEAGAEMIRQSLDRLGVENAVVEDYLAEMRQQRYRQEPDA